MRFIKIEELKPGMRLARPIYSKKGVLLYERAAAIKDSQSIQSIKGFGLIGLFILEPAEPVPPMTEQDLEFERFQTMMTFEIKDELETIRKTHKTKRIMPIAAAIIKAYGNAKGKINFQQSLRSTEDYIYKHSLNTAILCAMIAHSMNCPLSEQQDAVTAAIVHDIGKISIAPEILYMQHHTPEQQQAISEAETDAYELIDEALIARPNVRRICKQAQKMLSMIMQEENVTNIKMLTAARILMTAGVFDKETAVRMDQSPISEIRVVRGMLQKPDIYDEKVVHAIIDSVSMLFPGVSVELNTGEKALVISETIDPLRPIILSFADNSIINLMDRRSYAELEIVDIMKTMDNRYVIDMTVLQKFTASDCR
ncbi:MAG: HD domain-containing protein [Butyrivibrio sp.]|nr:HD domain-containing protein [Butyrivibrio sp.]